MLNPSYTIQKFSENFSKLTTIKQFIELTKAQKFDLEIDLVHRIPSVLTWCPKDDTFSGDYHLLVYPRITIDGKTFAPSKIVPIQLLLGMVNCETAFLDALKKAIGGVQQVWN